MLETRPPARDPADTAPGAAVVPDRRQRLLAVAVPVLVWIVVSAAGWFRLTPQVRNTVWAEDGKVFLEEQFDLGVVGALFHDYAGYLHVVPRIVVAIASHVAPIDRFAVTVSILCVLLTGAVGAAVYVLTAGVVRSVVARVLLAFVPALVPLGPMEIQANVANLHWFLMFLVPFALLTPVRGWTKGILLGVATLLAGLTEIQVVAFFPLFLLGLRNRHRWPVIAGTFLGGAAQVVTTLLHPRAPSSVPHDSIADMVLGYVVQPVAGSVTWSMPTVGRLIAEHGLAVVLVPFAVALVVVLVGFWFGVARQRWLLASMLWGSAAVWFGAVWFNPNEMLAFAHFDDGKWVGMWTFRYTAAASMYIVAAFVVVVDVALLRARTTTSRRARTVAVVAGAVLALAVVTTFVANYQMDKANRQGGPFWDQQVDSSESTCSREPTGNATVQIAPGPQWATTVPCLLIDRNASR
ncbi:hypothetical protein E9228_002883 [Curtobacterium flaccumfaciens]|uniref:Uncharacterized protein n=1 Tax=Curtobacterium salicis TaxID=1779862 RepID=A0ABX0T9S1_9MICO|nr:glycosyltransferase family 87 protein [Curtobacterium sp. WW7]NII42225.1 hypothetical protein [Curtobacterium sp. WW7]